MGLYLFSSQCRSAFVDHGRHPIPNTHQFLDTFMKHHRIFQTFSVIGAGFFALNAQETTTKWDVGIPVAINDATLSESVPKPEPSDFKVLSSHTTRMPVKEAPEMHDIPFVNRTINVTLQVAQDPKLTDPLPLPILPTSVLAVDAQMTELAEIQQGTELVFLSATVYNHHRTFLQIYLNGKLENAVTAWSNIDFNHFNGISSYRVKDAEDATLYDFGFLLGIDNIDTKGWEQLPAEKSSNYKLPEIPKMSDLIHCGPSFVVVEGAAESPTMDTLEQLHDLYRKEGARMEAAYHAREMAHAERRAYLLANPPKPRDVTIQFWKREAPSPRGVQALGGRAQP